MTVYRFVLSAAFGGLVVNLGYALYEHSIDKAMGTAICGFALLVATILGDAFD
jgi:hypothetical protein